MAEERVKRKLAAIVSADVVGWSRLMGEDEAAGVGSHIGSIEMFRIATLAAVVVLGVLVIGSTAQAKQLAGDVVTLVCAHTTSGVYVVEEDNRSANVPAATVGATCTQEIADLIAAGFELSHTEFLGNGIVVDVFHVLLR